MIYLVLWQNEARKFRVRFARGPHYSAVTTCESCAAKLSYFFPVRPYEAVQGPKPPVPVSTCDVFFSNTRIRDYHVHNHIINCTTSRNRNKNAGMDFILTLK